MTLLQSVPLDQHVLVPKGPQAAHIAELWWFYLAVMIVVCVLVWAFVLIAAFARRARHGEDETPQLDEQTVAELPQVAVPLAPLSREGEQKRMHWVLGASAITVLTLLVLLVASVRTSASLAGLASDEPLRIEIVGHRWWWSLRYGDEADPTSLFTTANELHIPVGKPVELTLSSADVIHSFWAPNLAGKRDLIPGRRSNLRIQADQPGVYRGQCAEFCGYSHAQMALLVIAEPKKQFEAWRSAQQQHAPEPVTAEAQQGRDVFLRGPCVLCHAIQGTVAQSQLGPDLTHVASRSSLAAGSLPNTRGHLAGWLLNAPAVKPGTPMPSMSLPSQDLHALIAYLESLR